MKTLRQWLMEYPLRTDNMTVAEWDVEYIRFCKDLREFHASRQ